MEQTHVTDANLQKEPLLEYERNFKNKSKEYSKFIVDKKSLITILFGQCIEAIQTKIALGALYTENRNAGRLLAFIERMRTVCSSGDNGGLSYGPYKQVVGIKSLNTYTINEPQDPHGYKELVKIKYEVTKVIVEKFPNGTAALMELLSKVLVPLGWAGYCTLLEENQLMWEARAVALNQTMLYLMNSKNENTKKDLRLAYFQGNNTTYPTNIKSAARYMSTKYPNNKPTNQRGGNKRNKRKGDAPKFEDKDSSTGGTAGAHVEDTTTNEDTTAPSGGASLGAHVSETNQALSRQSCTTYAWYVCYGKKSTTGTVRIVQYSKKN